MPDFLLEIGCEEIPARMIDDASSELRERVERLLQRERLSPAGAVSYLDTPRAWQSWQQEFLLLNRMSRSKSPAPR